MNRQPGFNNKKVLGKQRIGDILVDNNLISEDQLRQALKRQVQAGGRLGFILIEMGFITINDLINFLSYQSGVTGINLYEIDIDQKVLNLISLEKINELKILPIAANKNNLTLAMVNPQDFETISEIGFTVGRKITPVVVPSFMMDAARRSLLVRPSGGLNGDLIKKVAEDTNRDRLVKTDQLVSLLQHVVKAKASDMLLTAGAPPSLKISNEVKRLTTTPLTPNDCERYAKELLTDKEWTSFTHKSDHVSAVTYPDIGRFRVSVFRQRNSVGITLRSLPENIPPLETLNLPEWVIDFALKPHGLIMICGPTGHGKSTTLSAMVDIINNRRRCNIVTLEDPVEYLHQHKLSNINQREIGRDTESFEQGLKNVFRQAPDVIVIGDMIDKASFEIALKAANTGHLVLSTVHATNSTSAIESIITRFEPYQQNLTRVLLADSLLLCLSQRLVPLKKGPGRILAVEKLINSNRIKNFIREEKIHLIRSQMQTGAEDFVCLDLALAELYKRNLINLNDGLLYVENEQFYREAAGETRKFKKR